LKLHIAVVFLALTVAATAQQSRSITGRTVVDAPKPEVSSLQSPDKVELALTKVKLAIAQAQLANAAAQPLLTEAQIKAQAAQALIASTQKKLGLDDSYQWDFQAGAYLKKPQPVIAPATSNPPAPATAKP